MKLTLLLTLCLGYVSPSRIPNNEEVQNEDDPNTTIINGNDAERYQFPYMVSLQIYNLHWCGGSILSESWVISAAHCFLSPDHPVWKNVTAVAGLIVLGDNNEDVQRSPIVKIVAHPKYNATLNFTLHDIALLKLELPFFFTKAVKPVTLSEPNSEPSGKVWLSGWGNNFIGATPPERTPILQSLQMVVQSNQVCGSIFSKYPNMYPFHISPTLICTLPLKKKQSACHGDSGGPLVKGKVLVGIVHGGNFLCGVPWNLRIPNLFTKVSLYNQFVLDHVKDLPQAKSL